MRRSARALSAAVLAGAVLGLAGPVASAEPAAEVSPSAVSPGGSVTVSVSCDPTGGSPPEAITATSEAVDSGSVELRLVSGNEDETAGPAYSGTARLAPAGTFEGEADADGEDSAWSVDGTCPTAPGGQGQEWSAEFDVNGESGAPCTESEDGSCATSHPYTESEAGSYATGHPCTESEAGSCATGHPCTESEAGSCATSHPCTESQTGSCATSHPCTKSQADSCDGAVIQRGVRAGEGGAFNDSVPALVAGGLLIAGALGAGVHRLRRRGPAGDH